MSACEWARRPPPPRTMAGVSFDSALRLQEALFLCPNPLARRTSDKPNASSPGNPKPSSGPASGHSSTPAAACSCTPVMLEGRLSPRTGNAQLRLGTSRRREHAGALRLDPPAECPIGPRGLGSSVARATSRAPRGYGDRLQNSVFEIDCRAQQLAPLVDSLEPLILPPREGLRIYRLCAGCQSRDRSLHALKAARVDSLTGGPERSSLANSVLVATRSCTKSTDVTVGKCPRLNTVNR